MKKLRKINTCECGKIAKYMKIRPYSISPKDDLERAAQFNPAMYHVYEYLWKLNAVGRRKLIEHKSVKPFFREESDDDSD